MPFYNSFTFEIIRIWPCTLIAKVNICLFSPLSALFNRCFDLNFSTYLAYFNANSNNTQKVCHEATGVFIIKADFP